MKPCLTWALAGVTLLALGTSLLRAEEKKGPPTAQGIVKAMDEKTGTITLAGKSKEGQPVSPDQTFTLGKDAKITVDGKAGKLGDLKAGKGAVLQLSDDRKTVVAVLQGPKGGEKGKGEKGKEGAVGGGTVKAVDAAAGTIIVVGKAGEGRTGPEQSFTVAKDVRVNIDGRDAKLADLKPGYQVMLKLTEDRKQAVAISVSGPGVSGNVKSIDAAARTVTVEGRKSEGGQQPDQTFRVAADAKVVVEGKPGQLGSLKPNQPAKMVLSVDRKTVVAIFQGEGKKEKEKK